MRVEVDEDLPKLALTIVTDYGHDAVNVLTQGMGGWKIRPSGGPSRRKNGF